MRVLTDFTLRDRLNLTIVKFMKMPTKPAKSATENAYMIILLPLLMYLGLLGAILAAVG